MKDLVKHYDYVLQTPAGIAPYPTEAQTTYPCTLLHVVHGGIVDRLSGRQLGCVDQFAQGRRDILYCVDRHHLGVGLRGAQAAGASFHCLGQLY